MQQEKIKVQYLCSISRYKMQVKTKKRAPEIKVQTWHQITDCTENKQNQKK